MLAVWGCSFTSTISWYRDGPNVGYDFYSAEADDVFSYYTVFCKHWSMVLQYGASNVFQNPCGDVTACLANIYTLPQEQWILYHPIF